MVTHSVKQHCHPRETLPHATMSHTHAAFPHRYCHAQHCYTQSSQNVLWWPHPVTRGAFWKKLTGSTFPSQNVQNTPGSDHFWKLRCRKSARRCGTFPSQNVQNTPGSDHFWKLSKKCTPLWREAKLHKTPHVRATFGGSDVVSRGRRKGLCTSSKVSKT